MNERSVEREIGQYKERIAADLQRDGWEVLGGERIDRLPMALRQLQPDLIAIRGNEIMVGEIKSRNSSELQDLKAVADTIARLPNIRLEVFWFGDEFATDPGRERVREYASEAATLLRIGSLASAAVMAWAATEGAIDYFITDTKAPVPDTPGHPRDTWSLLSRLYSLGYINEEDFKQLTNLRKQRNAAAHFAGRGVPDDINIRYALDIAERMITGQYVSVDLMTDWFVDNHGDLIVGSSQQRATAPAEEEVRRLLRAQFPNAPADNIEAAVNQIVREAPL